MNNSIKKIVAGISTVAMMVSAMPIIGASADEADFEIRTTDDGVIITEYSGEDTDKITIPSEINGETVVGVDNFAFGLISQPVTIVVPETLKADQLGSEAFMTGAVINASLITESGESTVSGIMNYWINDKLDMGYDDDQIAEAIKKAYLHIGDVETGETVLSACVAVIKASQAGECGFSQTNIGRLNTALSLMSYNEVVLQGPDETETQEYASGKLNLQYDVVDSSVMPGDVNGNGKLDLQDLISVAKHRLSNPALTDPTQLLAADYNQDGKIDLQDIIAMAKARLANEAEED